MNRRSFISSILALGAAPAIVRADSLMRIVARDTVIIGVDLADGADIAGMVRGRWVRDWLDVTQIGDTMSRRIPGLLRFVPDAPEAWR